MSRRPVKAIGRRTAALLAAVALAVSGLLIPAPSDAAPFRMESLAQQEPPDLWTGDWLLEGQTDNDLDDVPDNGGAFVEFGVITLQKVTGPAAEAAISEENRTGGSFFTGSCLRDISNGDAGGHVYRGSYKFGTGGRLWGCADFSFEGLSLYIHYHGSDGGHGEILVEWEGGHPPTFSGGYGPPHFDPQMHHVEYLDIRGTRVEAQGCEAPASAESTSPARPLRSESSTSPTTARLAGTTTELARPVPIEGVWGVCGPEVEVTPGTQEGTFVGTALGSINLGCESGYRRGDKIWDIRIKASTPDSTQYGGTHLCEGERQATWEVFLDDDDFSEDLLTFCFRDPERQEEFCPRFPRQEPARRTFDVTLKMNAIGKRGGKLTPKHPLYLATTAGLKNGSVNGRWHGGRDRFFPFGARGTLIINDRYFLPHNDERTVLKVIEIATGGNQFIHPGREAAGLPPSAGVTLGVRVQKSQWKGCEKGREGSVGFAWNRKPGNKVVQDADTVVLRVCGRTRTYTHHDPDDKSRVNVELKERPPKLARKPLI